MKGIIYAITSFHVKYSLRGKNTIGCILYISTDKVRCNRITGALRNNECQKQVAEHLHFTHQYIDGVKKS